MNDEHRVGRGGFVSPFGIEPLRVCGASSLDVAALMATYRLPLAARAGLHDGRIVF